jgi:hypothetical protein
MYTAKLLPWMVSDDSFQHPASIYSMMIYPNKVVTQGMQQLALLLPRLDEPDDFLGISPRYSALFFTRVSTLLVNV